MNSLTLPVICIAFSSAAFATILLNRLIKSSLGSLFDRFSISCLIRQWRRPGRRRGRRRIVLGRVPIFGAVCRRFVGRQIPAEWNGIASKRPELSVLEVRSLVFHQKHNAAPHEPRVWHGEEDPVHDLSQAFPPKMEPRTAHKTATSRVNHSLRGRIMCQSKSPGRKEIDKFLCEIL